MKEFELDFPFKIDTSNSIASFRVPYFPVKHLNCPRGSDLVTWARGTYCIFCEKEFPEELIEKKAKLEVALRRFGKLKEPYEWDL